MKLLILILILGCLFWTGYYITRKMDIFFKKNEIKAAGYDANEYQIWIGTSISHWLYPYQVVDQLLPKEELRCRIRVGSESALMRRLLKREIDVAVLMEKPSKGVFEGIRYVSIKENELKNVGRDTAKDKKIWIVWNDKVKSKNRDRLLSALEDKQSVLRVGYCNY